MVSDAAKLASASEIWTLAPGTGNPAALVTLPVMSAFAVPAAQRVITPASAAERRTRRERAEVPVMCIPLS